jgi:hypothetical protein
MMDQTAQNGVFGGCAPGVAENPARAGIAPIVGAAMAQASRDLAASQPVQDELFEPEGRILTPQEARDERKRGRGRPAGAANKSSGDLRKFLQHQGVDPHMIMAGWLALSPEEMAARIGCKVAEALDRQMRMAESLMPYVRAKLAPVDDTGRAVPVMVFQMGNGGAGSLTPSGVVKPPYVIEGEAMGLEYELQGNQWVSKQSIIDTFIPDDEAGQKP